MPRMLPVKVAVHHVEHGVGLEHGQGTPSLVVVGGAQDELLGPQLAPQKSTHLQEKVALDLSVEQGLVAEALGVGRGKLVAVQPPHRAAGSVLIVLQVAAPGSAERAAVGVTAC